MSATMRAFMHRLDQVENDARQALSRAAAGSTLARSLEYAFVYRPGGVAGFNVFTTEATLKAAMALVQGPKLRRSTRPSLLRTSRSPAGTPMV